MTDTHNILIYDPETEDHGPLSRPIRLDLRAGGIRLMMGDERRNTETGPDMLVEAQAKRWAVHCHLPGSGDHVATVRFNDDGVFEVVDAYGNCMMRKKP